LLEEKSDHDVFTPAAVATPGHPRFVHGRLGDRPDFVERERKRSSEIPTVAVDWMERSDKAAPTTDSEKRSLDKYGVYHNTG